MLEVTAAKELLYHLNPQQMYRQLSCVCFYKLFPFLKMRPVGHIS